MIPLISGLQDSALEELHPITIEHREPFHGPLTGFSVS